MSKKLSLILSVFVLIFSLMCSAASAFAMGPSKDGVYEVPIEMWHAEKERTSMGDSYIVHTALLTVDGKEKTLTIAPAKTSSDMQFWYYTDGSVKGDTKEVSQSSAVEIDGKKYDVAFEFPIKSNNEFVGVKFAASAMPLSPSARIKIDYDSAKKIRDVKRKQPQKKPLPPQRQQLQLQQHQPLPSLKRKRLKIKKYRSPLPAAQWVWLHLCL